MTNSRFRTVRLSTGPRIHYAELGDDDGEPIVFLHGWPDSWFSFSRVAALFSPRLRALIPDQRGFGDSEKPTSGFSINEFAADVVAFLDATSVERVTIVGHSFGSFVARRVAISNPERIARMVLIGTGVSAVTPVMLEVQAAIRNIQDPVPTEFVREFQAGTAYASLPPSFFDRIVDESLKLPARLWRDVLDGVLAYRDLEKLSEIITPTLVIWGEHDALFSRKDQNHLVATIQGATLIIYRETGHCPNWERPERVAADLQGFLQQH